MKKILSVMKFACDCLVGWVMRRDENVIYLELPPGADTDAVAENLPARIEEEKTIPWAGIAAGVAVGLTAVTALAILGKGKKKK